MKIESELPEDLDPKMKIRSLQELVKIINEEITALENKEKEPHE